MTYRVQANLVHDCDTGLLALFVQLEHCGRDVRSSNNMLLGADSGLDNKGVEGVRDQGDSKVDLLEGLVESVGIVDI